MVEGDPVRELGDGHLRALRLHGRSAVVRRTEQCAVRAPSCGRNARDCRPGGAFGADEGMDVHHAAIALERLVSARHTARYGLSLSTSVETPVMVGFDLLAGVASLSNMLAFYAQQQGLLDYKTSLDFTSTILLLGGPVLLCAIGAAVSVVMTSKSRTRDVACSSLAARAAHAAGRGRVRGLHPCRHGNAGGHGGRGRLHAVTAYAVGMPLFDGLAFGEGLAVSLAGFVLVLAATLVPTLAALRKEPATVLAMGE